MDVRPSNGASRQRILKKRSVSLVLTSTELRLGSIAGVHPLLTSAANTYAACRFLLPSFTDDENSPYLSPESVELLAELSPVHVIKHQRAMHCIAGLRTYAALRSSCSPNEEITVRVISRVSAERRNAVIWKYALGDLVLQPLNHSLHPHGPRELYGLVQMLKQKEQREEQLKELLPLLKTKAGLAKLLGVTRWQLRNRCYLNNAITENSP